MTDRSRDAAPVSRPRRLAARLIWSGPLLLVVAMTASCASAQEDTVKGNTAESYYPSVWNLRLGGHARELPREDYIDYACGTNGGPPSQPLTGWMDFDTCSPEPVTDYREVYFRYDDELEYRGLARNMDAQIQRFKYTAVNDIPVIASILFDKDGFNVGLRLITDPRVDAGMRQKGMTFAGYMFARFGDQDKWSCTDLPKAEGEGDFQGLYIKRRCTLRQTVAGIGEADLVVETRNFRRRGQRVISKDNVPTQGEFESSTWFQITLTQPIVDREARLAEVEALGPIPPNPLVAEALDCPGCDLRNANLKLANLSGANLAGANLSGANLHGARLTSANLVGANLSGANVNHADARKANLVNADLTGAMLYGSTLDGSDLSKADLTGAMAGNIRLINANLTDAIVKTVDLRDSRLTSANLTGADLTGSWMHDAQMNRTNFTKAILIYVVALRADMAGANLTGVDARGGDFFGANMREANLTSADFSFTRLTSVNLFSSELTGANFAESELPAGFMPPVPD